MRETAVSHGVACTRPRGNNFDVKWVMSQVGHADSKMTMDVYAQLEQRIQRSHGTEFDRLVRSAREQLHGGPHRVPDDAEWATKRTRSSDLAQSRSPAEEPEREEPRDLQGSPEVARPGLEPGTPRFSVVYGLRSAVQRRHARRTI